MVSLLSQPTTPPASAVQVTTTTAHSHLHLTLLLHSLISAGRYFPFHLIVYASCLEVHETDIETITAAR